ncbi:alpha/beta hydrolase [Nitratifractor sp.]|uniref:RBBP9/YdeN family alpha/beta hydrolase n=1 Tax=Nitratifractor sp. TaxID=2268144 RepID=UPI0025F2FEE0|nr:alpha/beta hydrolase [Nitratifractor sp.]
MKLLLLHGWGGSDWPHWQAWLASEVAKNYGTVSFPLIQHPHYPHLNRWRKEVLRHLEDFRPDTVVCHSLANTLWFHLAERKELTPVKRLFLVAMPSLQTELETISSFYPCPLPESLYAEEVQLIVSDNDPYITVEEAERIVAHYQIPLTVLPDAGHINAESGYGEWPWILEQVRSEK